MKEITKPIYCCEYCNKEYFTIAEVQRCENRCKALDEDKQELEEYYKNNKPKFKVGDVLKVSDNSFDSINKYFIVTNVGKLSYDKSYIYYGIVGEQDGNGYYNPFDEGSVYEAHVKLKMTKEEFEAKCDNLKQKLGDINCEFDVCNNTDKFGIEIKIFE